MAGSALSKDRIVGVFDRAAPLYDTVGPGWFSRFGERLVQLADVGPGDDVLDVATGAGAVLSPASARARSVVGVDLAQGMLERVRALELPNVRVEQMDAEHLTFSAESFDVVAAAFVLFLLPDLVSALRGWRRVLRPGGRLALSTFGKGDPRWSWLRELRKSSALPGPDFDTADELETAVAAAGFDSPRVVEEQHDVSWADPEEWLATSWTHGQRGFLERLSPEELTQFRATAFAHLEQCRESDGRIHLVLTALYTLARAPDR